MTNRYPIFALLICSTVPLWAQVGASPRKASPELYKLMQKEAGNGLTVGQLREFKTLHDADATMRLSLQAVRAGLLENTKRTQELYGLVSSLPITVDAKILTEATEHIKAVEVRQGQVEDAQKARDAEAKADRKSSSDRLWAVLLATFSMAGGFLVHKLKDPDRRRAAEAKQDAQSKLDDERNAKVIAHMDASTKAAEERCRNASDTSRFATINHLDR